MARPPLYDDDLRRSLLDETARALAEGGVDAVSLRSVASAAGTSTNAVYALFGSKATLVDAVVREANSSLADALEATPTTPDPVADLLELGAAYRRWALAHPVLYEVMFGSRVPVVGQACAVTGNGPSMTAGGLPEASGEGEEPAAIAALVRMLARALDAGVLHGRLEDAVMSFWAGVHGMVSLELSGRLAIRGMLAGVAEAAAPAGDPWASASPDDDACYATHLESIIQGWR
ncbi:MAG: TetR/AcrR family transcriptional regulator [Actinomycetales bacterium]